MSRNTEKAQSTLNRMAQAKARSAGVLESNPQFRPKYVQLVKGLPQAEKWRLVVMGEISTSLTRIQDPSINMAQIRDINDRLNKLFREKRAWEHHIKLLGGADYTRLSGDSGLAVKGYKYYGRARELPDVKEMLEHLQAAEKDEKDTKSAKQKEELKIKRRTGRIGPFYYGCLDGDTASYPSKKDIEMQMGKRRKFDSKSERVSENNSGRVLQEYEKRRREELREENKLENLDMQGGQTEKVENFEDLVPTSEQVSRWIVEERKRKLMERLKN